MGTITVGANSPRVSQILLAFAAVFVASLAATCAREPDGDAEQAVRKAHSAWFEALLGEDTAALDHVLAEDVTLAFPGGNLMPRADFFSYLKSGELFYDSAEHDDILLRVYGKTGVVTGRSNLAYRFMGDADLEHLRYTAVYAHTDLGWRMVAWHSTLVPE